MTPGIVCIASCVIRRGQPMETKQGANGVEYAGGIHEAEASCG